MAIPETIPYLSEVMLNGLAISTNEVIESIEKVIVGRETESVWSAPKAVLLPEDGRYMMAALAAADEPPYLAVKTVVLNPRNPEKNLPQINGLVTLLDSGSGLPVAIIDGNWITAVRTAGLSAVAAKYMARQDAEVIAFVGCGVQARSHLNAFVNMYPLKQVRLFGRGQANINRLCELAETLSLKSYCFSTGEEAVKEADLIISSVTYSANLIPFLDAACLKPGAFVSATDLGAPWIKEQFAAFDQVVIDDLEQEAALPNKLAPSDYVTGDLAGLVLGRFRGRNSEKERNGFIFRGHALGDLAVSALAFQKSLAKGN